MLGRFTAIILVLVGLIFVFMSFAGGSLVSHTIANGRVLESRFQSAALKSEAFLHRTGRPPSQAELDTLLAPGREHPVYIFGPDFEACDADAIQKARLRKAIYVLAIWRGEWMECFAPSVGISTVALEPEAFTTTGSVAGDKIASILLLGGVFFVAFVLWRPKNKAAASKSE